MVQVFSLVHQGDMLHPKPMTLPPMSRSHLECKGIYRTHSCPDYNFLIHKRILRITWQTCKAHQVNGLRAAPMTPA